MDNATAETKLGSEIADFYAGQTLLVTGATGFVGKVETDLSSFKT